MAYNRDWDKGKDSWGDGGAWFTDRGGKGRDDDSYGDGKRRKFNNGVRGLSVQSSESLPSSVLIRAMTQVIRMKNQATNLTTNSLRAGRRTTHRIILTTTDRKRAFKAKSVWSPASPAPTSSSWAWILISPRRMFVDALYICSSTELNLCHTLAAGIPVEQWMQH